ncbi:MAG: NusG domain II-containing protein, partial [Desulfobacterales bacterium]|nr:NusG domain II-containing protein [Desulfobacterales bacterium]
LQMTLIRPLDIILLVIITAAAAGSFSLMEKEAGSQAEIYVNNRKTASFNLDGPVQLKDITTKIGKVRVKYGNGSVQVTQSPCIQKICVYQRAISHIYENIICLPAQLQIVIIDETNSLKSADGIDVISY